MSSNVTQALAATADLQAQLAEAKALLRESGARLKREAVHQEYDTPGDAFEPCGLWCRLCDQHVEVDHSDHAPDCIIAQIDRLTSEGQ